VEERDEYLAANKEYAKDLHALRSEQIDSLQHIHSLTAQNQQLLTAELASLECRQF
jgi:hypothetical protein